MTGAAFWATAVKGWVSTALPSSAINLRRFIWTLRLAAGRYDCKLDGRGARLPSAPDFETGGFPDLGPPVRWNDASSVFGEAQVPGEVL